MANKSIERAGKSSKKKPVAMNSKSLTSNKNSNSSKVMTAETTSKNQTGSSAFKGLSNELLLQMHDLMVKSRVLEERLIKIYRAGESYFWIGGPGEEAWGVAIGLLTNKGQGLDHDFLHLHYRCTPTLIAMGLPMKDSIRLMMNRSTDPSTGGRNFSNHYCFPEWNVAPVTSPIGVQYSIALGTAHSQKRHNKKTGTKSISVVTGGDAGTAEGDFASCLIWASRKGRELPMLVTVQNNYWGISTPFEGQHGEKQILDRAKAFQMPAKLVDGNDPVESYLALQEMMEYVRTEQKPAFLEAIVSRLYGHSSASGANPVAQEVDCLKNFEEKLVKHGIIKPERIKEIWAEYEREGVQAAEEARREPVPTADSVWDNTYFNSENADWRKF